MIGNNSLLVATLPLPCLLEEETRYIDAKKRSFFLFHKYMSYHSPRICGTIKANE